MALEIRQSVGLLAACVSIRDVNTGLIESILCASVLQAIDVAISALSDRDDRTAVVVVGEDETSVDLEVNLARRSGALAQALGQAGLFLTLAAQDIVRDRLQNDVRFEDFGIYGLEDNSIRAERLFAVLHPDLPEPELPHKKVAGNCPRLHKSFVGRHRERDELQDLILQRKLVTIIGPPGVGKTTTAIHVARSFDDEYEDGVWWFSVDDRTSLDELLQAIASTRGLLALKGPLTVERVAEGLKDKRAIIVLDGCERHAKEIGALSRAVLDACSSLTLLLTSTRALVQEDEFVYPLRPMSLPRRGEAGEDALIASDALSLFFERATQAGARVALDDRNVELAGAICESVDGLPVAIELVAASLRTTSLEILSQELAEDLVSLSLRSFGLSGVGRALRLSYDTMTDDQQGLLQRLALFRGEWKVEVAERLWGRAFPDTDWVALHRGLVDISMLAYDPDRDLYRMLHTIRSFCWEQSGARAPALLETYCIGAGELASQVCSSLSASSSPGADALLTRHYSDFMFAVECTVQAKNLEAASALMKCMVRFWLFRNLLEDAERMSTVYLDFVGRGVEAVRALIMLGVVNLRRRRLDLATSLLQQGLGISRETANVPAEASALVNLGVAMKEQGDLDRAREYYASAQRLLAGEAYLQMRCQVLCNLADLEVIVAAERKSRDGYAAALERAGALLQEAIASIDDLNAVTAQAVWHARGLLALELGDTVEAESYFTKAISVCARHDLRHEAGEATEALAWISLERGQAATAAKLAGLCRAIRKESGKTRTDREMERYGRLVYSICERVDRNRAEKLMRYGEKLDIAELSAPTIFNV